MYTNDLYPELKLRWEKIQKRMKKDGVEAIILSSSANLFYAAGRVFNGYIYITQAGDPFFFVRRPAVINDGKVQYLCTPEDLVDKRKEAIVPFHI